MTITHAVLAVAALGLLTSGCERQPAGDPSVLVEATAPASGAGAAELPTHDWEPGDGGLSCPPDQRLLTMYDYSGPGRPTPAEAVAPLVGRLSVGVTRITGDGRHATVTAVDAAGKVVREYQLTKASDGWWPDGYTACEAPKGR